MNKRPGFTADASLDRTNRHDYLADRVIHQQGLQLPDANVIQPAGPVTYAACVAICCAGSFLGVCPECFAACIPLAGPECP